MKRVLSAGILGAALALVGAAAPAHAQGLKIGFVNSQRVLSEVPGVQQAQTTLQGEVARMRAPLDSMEQRLNTASQQFQQQQATMTPAARDQRQNELQQQFAAYQQRGQQIQEQAAQRQQQLMAPVMQAIRTAIEAVRAAGGYTMIVDSSNEAIVAVDPASDITDQVIRRLAGTAAPAAGAPRP